MADALKQAENAVKAVDNSNIPRLSDAYIEMMQNTAQALSSNQQEATKIANDAFNASMGALRQSVSSANEQSDILYNQARTSLSGQFTNPDVSQTTINKLNTARTSAMGTIRDAGSAAEASARLNRDTSIGNAKDAYYTQLNNSRMKLGPAGIEAAYAQRQDERAFNYNKAKNIRDYNYGKRTEAREFNYAKAKDTRDFNYAKAKDTRDFNYTKANNAANRRQSLAEQAYTRSENLRKQSMDTYVDTISRFNTSGKIDSEISRLQKSSDPDRGSKIMYLQAYKAQLAAAAASGSGSSGGRSYGGRSYSSRSRSSGSSKSGGSSSGSSSAVPSLALGGAIKAAGDSAMAPYLAYGTPTVGTAGQALAKAAFSSKAKPDYSKVNTYVMTHPTATAEDIMKSDLNDREAFDAMVQLRIDGTEPKLNTSNAKKTAKASASKDAYKAAANKIISILGKR